MLIALLVVALILVNVAATYALVKSKYSSTATYHSLAIMLFSAWAGVSVLAERYDGDISENIAYNKLAFLFSYGGMVAMLLFSRSFLPLSSRKPHTLLTGAIAVLLAIYGVFTISPWIAGTVELTLDGNLLFLQGSMIILHALIFIALISAIIRNLLKRVKRGNYAEKNQARFIIFGLSLAGLVGIATNIIIPSVNPEYSGAGLISVLLVVIMVLPTTYALVAHRLIDVRPLAARSIALVLLVATLGFIYVLVLLWLNEVFLAEYDLSTPVVVFYATTMIALGFLLHPLYSFYNRLIGRLFLHRVYDSQKVINELNTVLVANLKLAALIPELQKVIRSNLDARFTMIKLRHGNSLFHQGKTTALSATELAELDLAISEISERRSQVMSIRDVVMDPSRKEVASLMLKHKLAIIGSIKQGNTPLGTMYISVKSSELPYTNQDLEIIQIILSQAGLAIQNALLYHEVATFNENLQKKIEDATKELRQTNAKLVAMDKAKDEFISIASHQLRTPLTTVKGYLSMLLEGSMGKISAQQKKVLQQSFDSSERMAYVVSDLLNLMRLRTDTFEIDPRSINLAEIVESELSYVKEQAKYKNLKLTYEKPTDYPELLLDEIKIRQVLKNFIYNALFYTLPGGQVVVELGQTESEIFFKVKDTGIGVPKEDQARLFSQFYRAKNARDIRPDGTGVGLFISKKVIAAHNGKVIFESKQGKGSTFGFSLSKKLIANPSKDS